MTTIKASCPSCGEVEMTSADVRLMVCNQPDLSYYAFSCPDCSDEVRKPADEHIVALLVSGGVPMDTFAVPEEVLEAKDGPALTYDDLLDFVLHLGLSDHLAPLAATALQH